MGVEATSSSSNAHSHSSVALQTDLERVDWSELAELYDKAQLGKRVPAQLERSFRNSCLTCIARIDGKAVGAGRVISDGEYYANVYDIAVLPEHQGSGVGRAIMENLVSRVGEKFILLTTTIGKEGFYRKLGFRRHKTAMAIYPASKSESAKLYLEDR